MINEFESADDASLGAVLRHLRRARRLSQAELAGRAGISERTVRNLELDLVAPRGSTIRLLSAALALSPPDQQRLFDASRGLDPTTDGPTPFRVVPAELPHQAEGVVGRQRELATLDELLLPPRSAVGKPLVVLTGLPGIGKTTLAVHWAERAAACFPDGQLYLDLHGYGAAAPTDPGEALGHLLQTLNVPATAMPDAVDRRAALWRSLLSGRRVLLVLDNARDAEQVRPLLPAHPGAAVLVTARSRLLDLVATDAAALLTVGPLAPADARTLLVRRLGEARVAAEPSAVAEIVDAAQGLPLRLAEVGARATAHPDFPLAAIAVDDRQATDRRVTVRAAFGHSFRTLPESAGVVLRSFGAHPGPDLDFHAAAALADLPLPAVRSALHQLSEEHLVVEHVPGRFRVVDLVRPYAVELDDRRGPEQRRAAIQRLVERYVLPASYRAALLLDRYAVLRDAEGQKPEKARWLIGGADDALRWLAAERANVVSLTQWAGEAGWDAAAWHLAHASADYLKRRGRNAELESTQHAALAAARRLGDARREALSHRRLADVALRAGRPRQVFEHLDLALRGFDRSGDTAGTAETRMVGAIALLALGRHRHAFREAHSALALHQIANNPVGVGRSWNAIGWDHYLVGHQRLAIENCLRSVDTLERLDDHAGAGAAWDSLGRAHAEMGNLADSAAGFHRAIDLFTYVGAEEHRADALYGLGETYRLLGEPDLEQAVRATAAQVRRTLATAEAASSTAGAQR